MHGLKLVELIDDIRVIDEFILTGKLSIKDTAKLLRLRDKLIKKKRLILTLRLTGGKM